MKPIEAPALSTTGEAPDRKPATKKTVAIIGAESAPGLGLVRAILDDPKGEFRARAIVRRIDSVESRLLKTLGAEISVADPRNEAALKRVLAGAHGAFYIQLSSDHPTPETKLATARAVAGAAKHAGLRHVIWATLEDPGQTFLEHHDVTPTFQNGRWISDGEGKISPEQIFTELAIPTTFLHTAWEATVAAGNWTEDIGKHAYALLRDGDSIGQTVSISAARLIRRPTPPPMPIQPSGSGPNLTTSSVITARKIMVPPTMASASASTSSSTVTVKSPPVPTTASSPTTAFVAPAMPPPVGPTPVQTASSPAKMRKIAIIGAVVAAGLVGLVVMRQVQSQKAAPAPDPVETPRPAEAVRPPPVAVKPPEPPAAAPPPVAAAPEAPPPPAEVAPPEEAPVATNDRAGGKRAAPAAKNNHKHPTSKAGPVATAPAAPQPAAAAAHPAVAPVKTEAPPKIETPPERAAPAEPPHPVVAVRAPPKPAAAAPAAPPPSVQRAPTPSAPQPGFIDPKTVAAVVRSHASEANACYERAVMEHPDLHGRLTIRAVVDPSGHVASVSPTSGINDGARLQTCLVGAFKSWTFPQPAGGVNGTVTYSFSFESP